MKVQGARSSPNSSSSANRCDPMRFPDPLKGGSSRIRWCVRDSRCEGQGSSSPR